ncbi:hypothetical protein GQ457_03G008920 [Hibiscus cannabinus]
MTVYLLGSFLVVSRITDKAVSMEAGASSNTKILHFFRSTPARQTSCLFPTLQFSPSSATAQFTGRNYIKCNLNYVYNLFIYKLMVLQHYIYKTALVEDLWLS